VPIRQVSEGRPIEHVRTNRDILGESDARHCHRPGTWQMGVHHDLSPSGLGAAGDRRVTPLLWPHGTSTVLGIDLKCSESGRRPLGRRPMSRPIPRGRNRVSENRRRGAPRSGQVQPRTGAAAVRHEYFPDGRLNQRRIACVILGSGHKKRPADSDSARRFSH
jgi:hypothetical protein